jgi:hypothetical protein
MTKQREVPRVSEDSQISMDMLHIAGWMLHAVVNHRRSQPGRS